jgi:hypothetical protein
MNHAHLLRIHSWSQRPRDWLVCDLFNTTLFERIRAMVPWRVDERLFTHVLGRAVQIARVSSRLEL